MKKRSIYDIAKRVNASGATVSYVLNGKEGKSAKLPASGFLLRWMSLATPVTTQRLAYP